MEQEVWFVRDSFNILWLVIGAKPIKLQCIWSCPIEAKSIQLDSSSYPEVKWSDNEPTKVKLVIDK